MVKCRQLPAEIWLIIRDIVASKQIPEKDLKLDEDKLLEEDPKSKGDRDPNPFDSLRDAQNLRDTSRLFRSISEPNLFHKLTIHWKTVGPLVKTLLNDPRSCNWIRNLTLEWGEERWHPVDEAPLYSDEALEEKELSDIPMYWTNDEWTKITNMLEGSQYVMNEPCLLLEIRHGRNLSAMMIVLLNLLPYLKSLDLGDGPNLDFDGIDNFMIDYVKSVGAHGSEDLSSDETAKWPVALQKLETIGRRNSVGTEGPSINPVFSFLMAPSVTTLETMGATEGSSPRVLLGNYSGKLSLAHLKLSSSSIPIGTIVELISFCKELLSFEYDYRGDDPQELDRPFSCRAIGDALRAHKDSLQVLKMGEDITSDFWGERGYIESLAEFSRLHTLDMTLDGFLGFVFQHSIIPLLPPNIENLTLRPGNMRFGILKWRGEGWVNLGKEIVTAKDSRLKCLTSLRLGGCERGPEENHPFTWQKET